MSKHTIRYHVPDGLTGEEEANLVKVAGRAAVCWFGLEGDDVKLVSIGIKLHVIECVVEIKFNSITGIKLEVVQ